jgi:hypothetical protein
VSATGDVGTVAVTVSVFDYAAVAHLYDRRRTVYVERHSTAKERTMLVLAESRRVYVDRHSTGYDRTSYVAIEPRQVYTDRKSTSADRSALVE